MHSQAVQDCLWWIINTSNQVTLKDDKTCNPETLLNLVPLFLLQKSREVQSLLAVIGHWTCNDCNAVCRVWLLARRIPRSIVRWDEERTCSLVKIKTASTCMCGVYTNWRVSHSIQIQYKQSNVIMVYSIWSPWGTWSKWVFCYTLLFLFSICHECRGCTLKYSKVLIPIRHFYLFSGPWGWEGWIRCEYGIKIFTTRPGIVLLFMTNAEHSLMKILGVTWAMAYTC